MVFLSSPRKQTYEVYLFAIAVQVISLAPAKLQALFYRANPMPQWYVKKELYTQVLRLLPLCRASTCGVIVSTGIQLSWSKVRWNHKYMLWTVWLIFCNDSVKLFRLQNLWRSLLPIKFSDEKFQKLPYRRLSIYETESNAHNTDNSVIPNGPFLPKHPKTLKQTNQWNCPKEDNTLSRVL